VLVVIVAGRIEFFFRSVERIDRARVLLACLAGVVSLALIARGVVFLRLAFVSEHRELKKACALLSPKGESGCRTVSRATFARGECREP